MKYLAVFFVVFLMVGCQSAKTSGEAERLVLIKTTMGDITVKLYNETPQHRDNFLKLAEEGFYDSLLFHRVIDEFMVQGGDPESKGAEAGAMLGNGGPGYTIPAEIKFPELYHKKGVLAAARQGDNVNPEKRSSGSQFYIVQGKVFNDAELNQVEDRVNNMRKQQLFYSLLPQYQDTLNALRTAGDQDALMNLQNTIMAEVEKKAAENEPYVIPEELKAVYRTMGGTPHLDSNYTVFGEVVEGLNVVDSIAAVQKGMHDRPVNDIQMFVEVIK
jgi:cyclophilin family peptidyl-prolyl cis-trans isomerase